MVVKETICSTYLIDVSALAYRSFYSMRDLEADGVPTAVIYGVLREIITLRDLFGAGEFVFAFDRGGLLRKKIYPEYKAKRREDEDADKREARMRVFDAIKHLRTDVLPELGYVNLIGVRGYEADDVIAAVCQQYPKRSKVIVSADQDLYQLLSDNTKMYSPASKKVMTRNSFEKKYGIDPALWAHVKAIAGCSSDNIEGVAGVGEITAIKFLTGSLVKGKKYDAIVLGQETVSRNLSLVRLPFDGFPDIKLRKSTVTKKAWRSVLRKYKITTLRY